MIIKEKKLNVESRDEKNFMVVKIGSLDHNFVPGSKQFTNLVDAINKTYPNVIVVPEFTGISVVNNVLIIRYGSKVNKWVPTVKDCEKLQTFVSMQDVSKNFDKVIVIPTIFNMIVEDDDGFEITLDFRDAKDQFECEDELINEHVQRAGIIFDMFNEDKGYFKNVVVE